jgi:hypothetical protein
MSDYQPGAEVNGHILSEAGVWVQVYTTPPPPLAVRVTNQHLSRDAKYAIAALLIGALMFLVLWMIYISSTP